MPAAAVLLLEVLPWLSSYMGQRERALREERDRGRRRKSRGTGLSWWCCSGREVEAHGRLGAAAGAAAATGGRWGRHEVGGGRELLSLARDEGNGEVCVGCGGWMDREGGGW